MKTFSWVLACAGTFLLACTGSDTTGPEGSAAKDGGTSGSAGYAGEAGAAGHAGEAGVAAGAGGVAGSGGDAGGAGVGGAAGSAGGAAGTAGSAGAGECAITSEYPPCEDCFLAACEPACVAVSSEPTSDAFWDCLMGCGTTACFNKCMDDYPDAVAVREVFDDCVEVNCSAECL